MFLCVHCNKESPERLAFCEKCLSFSSFIQVEGSRTPGVWASVRERPKPKSVVELRLLRQNLLKLPPRFADLRLPYQFSMLVSGKPGQGKSTFLLGLADCLASEEYPCLYVSSEEGTGGTLIDRLLRLEVRNPHISVSSAATHDEMLEDFYAGRYKLLMVDSISVMPTVERYLPKLFELKDISIAFSAHSRKSGGYKGSSLLAHAVDVHVDVEAMKWKTLKNRFAALTEGTVLESETIHHDD